MSDDTFTSGFIGQTMPPVDVAFTDIQEIYTSRSGWNRLFRCHRHGKLHVLKTLQPMYKGTAFYACADVEKTHAPRAVQLMGAGA